MLQKAYYTSTFGVFEIKGTSRGIQSLKLIQNPPHPLPPTPEILEDVVQQLDEYFNKKRKDFDLKLDWSVATDFNRAVWTALTEIPYGHTTSYSAIAKKVGSPKASQAVGLANKNNPIAIVVPCHRVIAKNGDLHGYFYGLDMKRKLLEIENPMSYGTQGSLF